MEMFIYGFISAMIFVFVVCHLVEGRLIKADRYACAIFDENTGKWKVSGSYLKIAGRIAREIQYDTGRVIYKK